MSNRPWDYIDYTCLVCTVIVVAVVEYFVYRNGGGL